MAKPLNLIICEKPSRVQDLTGRHFNQLTVQSFAGLAKANKYWLCLCQCGNSKIIAAKHFTTGKTQSCGCFQAQDSSNRNRTHGESASTGNTTEYRSYSSAKDRCTNPNATEYARYGERGIQFRFDSYEQFLAHIGRKPSPKHSLDRIDVNGHYEIGNVRWATAYEQAQNTRFNRMLTFNGITLCLSEWSRRLGMTGGSLAERLQTWCLECALTLKAHEGQCIHR